MNPEAEFIKGDIRNSEDLEKALIGVEAIIHEASLVDTNQSQALVERQALNSPYSGLLSTLMNRLINGKPPIIFEDGFQTRSFIHVRDVVEATILALERAEGYVVYNVGADESVAIRHVAEKLMEILDSNLEPQLPGLFRIGDVRHVIPDLARIQKDLGFIAKNRLEDALEDYVKWALRQPKPRDNFEEMLRDFKDKGLIK